MGLEIERKFLVINDQWKDSVISESVLKQGYLSLQANATVRVRVDGHQAFLTVKSATTGISRAEFEYSIPVTDAESMLQQIAEKPFVDKIRYKVKCGDHVWDLDLFHGANLGLVVAEVELDHEQESFEMPAWAGQEVSSDSRYRNTNLVSHPFNQW